MRPAAFSEGDIGYRVFKAKKIGGRMMRYKPTQDTESVDGFKLTEGVHRGYVRIFNNGDDPAFNWKHG